MKMMVIRYLFTRYCIIMELEHGDEKDERGRGCG